MCAQLLVVRVATGCGLQFAGCGLQFFQANHRWKALGEIFTMHSNPKSSNGYPAPQPPVNQQNLRYLQFLLQYGCILSHLKCAASESELDVFLVQRNTVSVLILVPPLGRIDWIFLLNHSRSRRSSLAFNESSQSVQRARTSLISIASLSEISEKTCRKRMKE